MFFFYLVIKSFIIILLLLISVAFFTLAERKVIASVQRRLGPNAVGLFGVLQPIADGLKAILKENILPQRSQSFFFFLSPMWVFFFSLLNWGIIPFSELFFLTDFSLNLLWFLLFSSLGAYGVVFSGWASNSRYSFMGSLRAVAQFISYELLLSIVCLLIVAVSGSYNFSLIVLQQSEIYNFTIFIPFFILFIIVIFAETNRTPFDLPEAEAELVAGYNLDYSGFIFALFFLGEYSNMLLMAYILILLFFGGFINIYFLISFSIYSCLKIIIFLFFYIFIRSLVPRYRYDQLMFICWASFLPLSLSFFFFYLNLIFFFNFNSYNLQSPKIFLNRIMYNSLVC